MVKRFIKNETVVRAGTRLITSVFVFLIFAVSISGFAQEDKGKLLNDVVDFVVIKELEALYSNDKAFQTLMDKALSEAVTPPGGCVKGKDMGPLQKVFGLSDNEEFCWHNRPFSDLVKVFKSWLQSIVWPEEPYTGFEYYTMLYSLAYENNWAMQFLETEPGLSWTKKFTKARGLFMDSSGSINQKVLDAWKQNIGLRQWEEYKIPEGGFKNFNEFFAREVKDGARPVAGPGIDSILVSPADSNINIINANLKATTQINTKYGKNLNIRELLGGSTFADSFNGGTAISCVLMPNVYHRYHSPVKGAVVESKDVNGVYFGMGGNFYSYINNGNVGGYLSNYGIFGIYHRGYYIIQTENYGNVAMIPIGLDDISSVNFVEKFANISKQDKPVPVKKGEEVGHFAYGGSTIILLFQPGVLSNLSVNQGMQIGQLAPVSTP